MSLLKLWFLGVIAMTSTGRGIALISARQLPRGRNTLLNTAETTVTPAAALAPRGGSMLARSTASADDTDDLLTAQDSSNGFLSAGEIIMGDPSLVRYLCRCYYNTCRWAKIRCIHSILNLSHLSHSLTHYLYTLSFSLAILTETRSTQNPLSIRRHGWWPPRFRRILGQAVSHSFSRLVL